jgi:hypothetical protein
MTSLKIEILNEIKETLSSSSIHSFPNIVQTKFKSIKFVWVICFLISSSACAFFITTSLNEYFEYDIVSKTNTKYKTKIDFPIISICETNPFSNDFAGEFIRKEFNLNLSDFDYTQSASALNYDFLTRRYLASAMAMNYNESIRVKFGKNLDYLIMSCLFGLVECNLTQDFEYYYDINYGNCFRYNIGQNLKQITNNGITNGLQLDLFVGKVEENDYLFSIDSGINLFIENDKVESQLIEGIRISAGKKTLISLSKHSINYLPHPYSQCTAKLDRLESSENIYFKNLIASNKKYRRSLCRYNCFQKYLGETCKCQDIFIVPFYNDLPHCSKSSTQAICLTSSYKNFSQFGLYEDCNCPIRCLRNYYSFELSYSDYPTKFYARFLFQNKKLVKKYNFSETFNYEDYRNSIASINIYYDELKEINVEHNAKITEVDLISNIGGTLGKNFRLYFDKDLKIVKFIFI